MPIGISLSEIYCFQAIFEARIINNNQKMDLILIFFAGLVTLFSLGWIIGKIFRLDRFF